MFHSISWGSHNKVQNESNVWLEKNVFHLYLGIYQQIKNQADQKIILI